ncbi:hypothetical protein [Vitiosangium sp. GDMCC 1.1324]|uniref:hypothetical protein n=1 Tax=Vitiosangium sp. (strain GDMCC 1.1324) TaxID=2138576 RepID=UPI000D3BBD1F|nr:hypothetical protein [Vitiosangium sp. GDMCC 1.1324]PTL84235.1 hypothetical protein DAT35_12450 [Vitiosangium sp. GDMCC 1.1324]
MERSPSPEDVRRQLEGRVETVEAARARYAALESLLSGRKWQHRLREQLAEALSAVPAHHHIRFLQERCRSASR